MRLLAVCGLLVLATPALAQPAPAGSCSLKDGLVAQLAPPPGTVEPAPDAKGQWQFRNLPSGDVAPKIVSMPLPRMGNAVLDVTFRIEADGAVTNLKVLCISPNDDAVRAAVEKASQNWKFTPMKHEGKATAFDAAYRISGAGRMPLNFAPEKLGPADARLLTVPETMSPSRKNVPTQRQWALTPATIYPPQTWCHGETAVLQGRIVCLSRKIVSP